MAVEEDFNLSQKFSLRFIAWEEWYCVLSALGSKSRES
jgi:hypothetical protein